MSQMMMYVVKARSYLGGMLISITVSDSLIERGAKTRLCKKSSPKAKATRLVQLFKTSQGSPSEDSGFVSFSLSDNNRKN